MSGVPSCNCNWDVRMVETGKGGIGACWPILNRATTRLPWRKGYAVNLRKRHSFILSATMPGTWMTYGLYGGWSGSTSYPIIANIIVGIDNRIKYTFENSMDSEDNSLPYLDVRVRIQKGTIITDLYSKPTDTFDYVPFKGRGRVFIKISSKSTF